MEEDTTEFIERVRKEYQEKNFFIEQGLGAEIHWFFTQATQALDSELYLTACSAFLNAIEASLRVTLAQVKNPGRIKELDPIQTLSYRLLKTAQEAGLSLEKITFKNG